MVKYLYSVFTIAIEKVDHNFNHFHKKWSAYRIDVVTREVENFYVMILTFTSSYGRFCISNILINFVSINILNSLTRLRIKLFCISLHLYVYVCSALSRFPLFNVIIVIYFKNVSIS